MQLNELINKTNKLTSQLTNKLTRKLTEKISVNWQKKLAYFFQELVLMMPRVELKNLFGLELFRVGLLVAVLFTLPETCPAQGTPAPAATGSLSVKSVAKNAFNTIYDDWRLPVCGLLFFLAVFFYFQGGEQGLVKAVAVVVGMVIWALVPYFKDTVFAWFGQKLD